MKAVILAGGLGTRISEESHLRPKPLIEIGGRPILWHIMKIFSAHGVREFVICCGYKGYLIKEYFSNYFLHMADVTFDISQNKVEVHQQIRILGASDTAVLKLRVGMLFAFAERAPARCCHQGVSAFPTAIVLLLIALLLPHQTGTAALDALHAGAEHTFTYFWR